MMKKLHIYLFMGLAFSFATSCKDTLDTHPTEIFVEDDVWAQKSTADAFVNSTYASVLGGIIAADASCIAWESRTPNAVCCDWGGTDGVVNESGISRSSDYGTNRFSVLRRCNLIIEKAQTSTTLSDSEKADLVAQGRFLRGLVFYDQARKIGRFVPLTQVLTASDEEACRIPMTSSVAESYKYVIEDLEAAAVGLPETSSAGLGNKYAADVFLSRACLQAYAYTQDASYLTKAINAAKDVTDNKSLSQTYGGMFNENDAYNSEILLGYYRLSTNTLLYYYDEMIRAYPNVKADDIATSLCPNPLKMKNGITFEGWSKHYPTQDLVDQYLVTDEKTGEALPWYETSQFLDNVELLDPATITTPGQIDAYNRANGDPRRIPTPNDFNQVNPAYTHFLWYATLKSGATRTISDLMYSSRDARFATSIVYDGTTWLGEDIDTNLGGNLSQGVRNYEDGSDYTTTTGYYWRKNTLENPDPRAYANIRTDYHLCVARVGEAYMNLAEAYLLSGNIPAAVEALNATRTTHGKLAPSKATTAEEAWTDYMRERRVEMCNEGADIYFSYLRWGKYGGYSNYGRPAGDVIRDLDRPIYKIEINRDRSTILVGQMTFANSANRLFTTKRYLFPVAQGFLDTREAYGLDHTQNEGW